ncbi:MAG: hypothetical protein ACTSVP_13375 [Candidatus Heimdallarchaeota archaeon]
MVDFVSSGVEKLEKFTLGKAYDFTENSEEVMKELGLFKSDQEQSTEFIARGLPSSMSELTFLSHKKLTALQNIYEVSNLHYQAFTGQRHEAKQDTSKQMVWDELGGKFVSQDQKKELDKIEKQQLQDYFRQDFKRSIPDFLMKSVGLGVDTNDRMSGAGSIFDSLREKLGMQYSGRNLEDAIDQAQASRRTTDSYHARRGFSEKQAQEQMSQDDPNFENLVKKNKAGLGIMGAGGGMMAGALGMTSLPLLSILAPLLGAGALWKGAKKVVGRKQKLQQAFMDDRNIREGEETVGQQSISNIETVAKLKAVEEEKARVIRLNDQREQFKPIDNGLKDIKKNTRSIRHTLLKFSQRNYSQLNELISRVPKPELLDNHAQNQREQAQASGLGGNALLTGTRMPSGFADDHTYDDRLTGTGRAFAKGGIVTRRIDNATIGEAGPEAVIPLDKYENSRTISQELKEVSQKRKDKKTDKFQSSITTGFDKVMDFLKQITGNTGDLSGGDKKKGGILGMLGKGFGMLTSFITGHPLLAGGIGLAIFALLKKFAGKDKTEIALDATEGGAKVGLAARGLKALKGLFSKAGGVAAKAGDLTSKALKLPGKGIEAMFGLSGKAVTLAGKGLIGVGKLAGKAAWPLQVISAAWQLKKDIGNPERLNDRLEEFKKAGILSKVLTLLNPYEMGTLMGTQYMQIAAKVFTGDKNNTGFIGDSFYNMLHGKDGAEHGLIGHLTKTGVIDKTNTGSSIVDYDKIKYRTSNELKLLSEYNDFDKNTKTKLNGLYLDALQREKVRKEKIAKAKKQASQPSNVVQLDDARKEKTNREKVEEYYAKQKAKHLGTPVVSAGAASVPLEAQKSKEDLEIEELQKQLVSISQYEQSGSFNDKDGGVAFSRNIANINGHMMTTESGKKDKIERIKFEIASHQKDVDNERRKMEEDKNHGVDLDDFLLKAHLTHLDEAKAKLKLTEKEYAVPSEEYTNKIKTIKDSNRLIREKIADLRENNNMDAKQKAKHLGTPIASAPTSSVPREALEIEKLTERNSKTHNKNKGNYFGKFGRLNRRQESIYDAIADVHGAQKTLGYIERKENEQGTDYVKQYDKYLQSYQDYRDGKIDMSELSNAQVKKTYSRDKYLAIMYGGGTYENYKELYLNSANSDKADSFLAQTAREKININDAKSVAAKHTEQRMNKQIEQTAAQSVAMNQQSPTVVPVPVPSGQQAPASKQSSQQENEQPIDIGLQKSIASIFNSSSSIVEEATKKYVFDNDVKYDKTG